MSYVHWPCFFFEGHKRPWISIAFDTTQALCSIPHVRLGGMHRQAKTCLTFWVCPRDGYGFVLKKCGLTTNWPPMCLHMFALWKTQKSWDLFEVIYFQTKPDTNAIDPSRCERRFAHAQCTGNPRLQLRSILILFWAEPCAMVKIGTCPPARDSHSPYKHREEGF